MLSDKILCRFHTPSHLVCSSVSKTREQGDEPPTDRGVGCISEDNFVQVCCRLDLADIAHKTLGCGVDGVEDHELSQTRTSCPLLDMLAMIELLHVPAPKNRAVLDSLLYSLADELVPAATCATFATVSDGMGDIVTMKEGRCD